MLVELERVGHRFRRSEQWLFRNVSFEFRPGQVYALTGPSGSGKSTLLSLVARHVIPVEGSVRFEDIRKVNWVFQNPLGSPRRTSLDHVTQPILTRGVSIPSAEEQARELMARFGLENVTHRQFHELSGGEAQRLMLARGLASRPDLFLIDEPTAQLDTRTARRVADAIRATATARTIVIVATHDPHTRDACSAHLDLGTPPRGGTE